MTALSIAGFIIFPIEYLMDFVIINGVLHWITDLITSRINARLYNNENKHWFYIGIGFDQFIHAVCLIYTYEYYSSLDSFPYFFQLIF